MIYKRGSKYCYEFIWNVKCVRVSGKMGAENGASD